MEKQKRKTMRLAVLGVGLQTAGAICMMSAAVAAIGGIKKKTKEIMLKELHKQLETV